MGVPIRHILALLLLLAAGVPCHAASGAVSFSGTVGDGALQPARARITTFGERAAIDMVIGNPAGRTANIAFSSTGEATFHPASVTLAPGQQAVVRAFLASGEADARAVTVCATAREAGSARAVTRHCAHYAIRRLKLD